MKEGKTMKKERNFTYTITGKDEKFGIVKHNVVNRAKGYGQSKFETEEKARKALEAELKNIERYGFEKVIGWTLEGLEGIIERG